MKLIVDRGVPVPMRDGTTLATDVYRRVGHHGPALLSRTPYGADLPPLGRPVHGLRLVEAGYALVLQDVRGRGRSGGTFSPFAQELGDSEDTLAWLVAQGWSDGRVGMLGSSYLGQLQWGLAARAPRGLRAIAPHVAGPDVRRWFWRGGALEWGFALWWTLQAHALPEAHRRAAARRPGPQPAAVVELLDALDSLYAGGPERLPAEIHELVPAARSWMTPGPPADTATMPAVDVRAVSTPTLVVTGWHDIFLSQALAAHVAAAEAGTPSRLVVGPWSHTVWGGAYPDRDYGLSAAMDAEDVTGHHQRWFDRWLRDEARDDDAPVRYFLLGADAWCDASRWPVPTTEERWYLHAPRDGRGGLLHRAPPASGDRSGWRVDPRDPVPTRGGQTLMAGTYVARDAGPWDQRSVHGRPDVLTFATEPLDRPVDVLGAVRLEAVVTSSSPDVDVTCKLVDVHPDGRVEHLVDGIRRLSSSAGPDGLPALAPGERRRVGVEVGATAARFRAGHRIGIEIGGTNFPRFDLCPRSGEARTELHHDAEPAPHLVLPVSPP